MGRFRLYKKIGEYEKIPRFYGVAYNRPDWSGSVCYPIPINILIKWIYDFSQRIYRYLKIGGYMRNLDELIIKNYDAGYKKAEDKFKSNSIKCWVCGKEIFSFPEPKNHPQHGYKYWPCPVCGSDIFAMMFVDRLDNLTKKYNREKSDAVQAEGQDNLPL